MPLMKSGSKEAMARNMKTEMAAGRPKKQAMAIAMSTQRRAQGMKGYGAKPKKS